MQEIDVVEEAVDMAVSSGKRAMRRHHLERVKQARKEYWGYYRWNCNTHMTERQQGIVAATPAVCSCWMCQSPRRAFGERTVQELRAMQPELQDCYATEE